MKTGIREQTEWERFNSPEEDYWWCVVLDDHDSYHGHEDGGAHAFPCTREQLVALRQQITQALGDDL